MIQLAKIEKYILYVLIFSIPLNTRKLLYSAEAVGGFNEWQSIFLYGTDLLLIALLVLWGIRGVKNLNFSNYNLSRISVFGFRAYYLLLIALLLFSLSSIFFAQYLDIGWYRFAKLLFFVALFFYVVNKKFSFKDFALPFTAGAVLQSVIAVGQFLKQSSLGLWFLGEPNISVGRQDVAEIVAFGGRFLRSYGTTTSPNVLAAFLGISIFVLLTWYLTDKKLHKGKNFILTSVCLVLLSVALMFTFSRSAIIIFAPILFLYFVAIFACKFAKSYKDAAKNIALPAGVGALVFGVIYLPEIYERFVTSIFVMRDLAVVERKFLFSIAQGFILDNPGGVGIGNFTLYFRETFGGLRQSLYQPVHNIYLLSAVEVGILGGLSYTVFLFKTLWVSIKRFLGKEKDVLFLFSVCVSSFIILTGALDHYYWTLQQGLLMFWIVIGVVIKIIYAKKPKFEEN